MSTYCGHHWCPRWWRSSYSDWGWWNNFNWGWNWKSFQRTSSEEELSNEWLQENFQALQEEHSSLQEPANIMHIKIHDQTDANIPVKISGANVITLHDAGTNISCTLYTYYVKLKYPLSLEMIPTMSVHSATGHDLCPLGLTCCEVTIGKSQFTHTFTMCKRLKKNLPLVVICNNYIILGCSWDWKLRDVFFTSR